MVLSRLSGRPLCEGGKQRIFQGKIRHDLGKGSPAQRHGSHLISCRPLGPDGSVRPFAVGPLLYSSPQFNQADIELLL